MHQAPSEQVISDRTALLGIKSVKKALYLAIACVEPLVREEVPQLMLPDHIVAVLVDQDERSVHVEVHPLCKLIPQLFRL